VSTLNVICGEERPSPYKDRLEDLTCHPRRWLVTGVAGFIGSNLLETLLEAGQLVVGLDNFSTGHQRNLDEVRTRATPQQWANFEMIEGDVEDLDVCVSASRGVDFILHQAALGSVPRSIDNPLATHASNVNGFLNMLVAARENSVRRLVYASSSSVYGNQTESPKVEDRTGPPASPYAVTKAVNELYAGVFAQCYGMSTIGLRYFNVFGRRQDPDGAYAAVIPKWIAAMIRNEPIQINGDGETSRDFCYVENVVQANVLAATAENPDAANRVYNVAVGERTSLNELFGLLKELLLPRHHYLRTLQPLYRGFRAGDVRHSLADIEIAHRLIGYQPVYRIERGLREALEWYETNLPTVRSTERQKWIPSTLGPEA
jgi:UDP-N-acetylglucosamine 4-epimerase